MLIFGGHDLQGSCKRATLGIGYRVLSEDYETGSAPCTLQESAVTSDTRPE